MPTKEVIRTTLLARLTKLASKKLYQGEYEIVYVVTSATSHPAMLGRLQAVCR
jgi:hypothetical protein